MKLEVVPLVGDILASGIEDRVFRSLLLVGPLVIAVVAIVGRSTVTVGIASVYLLVFVANIFYNGMGTLQ